MKSMIEAYTLTHTVDETIQLLAEASGSARIVSGGSDLLLEIQQGKQPPIRRLVDVSEVEEMRAVEIREGCLFIGAAVTLTQCASSTLIKTHAQALAEAATLMGNPQVCNVATIGGNVAHALPAADGAIALLALDAQAEVANLHGRHRVPLQALFKGPGLSTLVPGSDLLVGFYLPSCEKGQASAFSRRVNPQGVALAILNIAIWLQREKERIIDIRIAVGPSGPIPMRMRAAEKAMLDQTPSHSVKQHALDEINQEAHFRTSPHRASAEYRGHLAGVLLEESFDKAWKRAGAVDR